MVITAATPIVMPSVVSAVRSLWRPRARSAMRSVCGIIAASLVAQRLDRIEARGLARRVVAEEDADPGRHRERERDRGGRDRRRPLQHLRDDARGGGTER